MRESRTVTGTANGNSDAILVPVNDLSARQWILSVSSADWGGSTATLEASVDGTNWFSAESVSGTTNFTANGAVIVHANLYYRIVISSFNDNIVLKVKPT